MIVVGIVVSCYLQWFSINGNNTPCVMLVHDWEYVALQNQHALFTPAGGGGGWVAE